MASKKGMRRCVEVKRGRIPDGFFVILLELAVEGGNVATDDKCGPEQCKAGVSGEGEV